VWVTGVILGERPAVGLYGKHIKPRLHGPFLSSEELSDTAEIGPCSSGLMRLLQHYQLKQVICHFWDELRWIWH